jgi:pre-mRNA-processing factor 19
VQFHPLDNFFVSAGLDGAWCFHDLAHSTTRAKVTFDDAGFNSAQIHPDGILLATACTDAIVRVWDISQQVKAAEFPGHTTALKEGVTSVEFSEIGYLLASADRSGCVKIWDLRKTTEFKSLEPFSGSSGQHAVRALKFDPSGQFLAVGSQTGAIMLYDAKTWDLISTFSEHDKEVSAIDFGPQSAFMVSVGKDRALKLWN